MTEALPADVFAERRTEIIANLSSSKPWFRIHRPILAVQMKPPSEIPKRFDDDAAIFLFEVQSLAGGGSRIVCRGEEMERFGPSDT